MFYRVCSNPTPIRLGVLAFSLAFGFGALAYLVAALVIPPESEYKTA